MCKTEKVKTGHAELFRLAEGIFVFILRTRGTAHNGFQAQGNHDQNSFKNFTLTIV